jgi:carboxyl-terminal processing protease
MAFGRTIISAILAFSLTACGGGSSSNTSGGSGSTGGTADCSLGAREDWAFAQLNEWYLFPDKLATNVNKANYNDLQSYIDAVVAPSVAPTGGPLQHAGLTYITSIAAENDLIQNGSNAGFGIRLSYDTSARRVFVVEAFETAPAFAAGIDRGSEILAINGQSVASIMAANPGNPAGAVSDAFGPTQAGVTRSLTIRQPDGTEFTADVTKADYALDPLSDRYGAKILDNGGTKVGYINLRTFIIQDAETQLRTAIDQFRQQGITQVILDLRYNGGGLVSVAEVLGDLLGADKVGQVFSKTNFRNSKSSNDTTKNFASQPQAIAAMKIALIGTGGTASASELVPNAFIPYLNQNIALIGSNTYGKPVGQIARDRTACDDRLRLIAFRTVNAADNGDYYGGLADVMPRTCAANDNYLKPLGDPTEDSIATALDFLAGRSCSAIAAKGSGVTAQAALSKRELMMPSRPSAAQLQIPGLF